MIGNILKSICCKPSRLAQILIGYIPTSKLLGLTNKTGWCQVVANLFHACMHDVLQPIIGPGGSGVTMKSGNGVWHRCHPIFANFIGDYPEQALVTCTFSRRCPKCNVSPGDLGEYQTFPPCLHQLAIDTYHLADEDVYVFHAVCTNARLKPIYCPFWELLQLANIFISITSDILHQLLQGMMKHVINWLVSIFGPTEIDARSHTMPPNHNIMFFAKGITCLSRVIGHEHKKMCSLLLGLIVDLPILGGRDSTRLMHAVRSLLDFLYLKQYQCHSCKMLDLLWDALLGFYNHKAIFTDLGVWENFNIPKLHSLTHYISLIELFGTTDNYNTKQLEQLYIDFTKDTYRATNRKNVYAQMTTWLQRREKILLYDISINKSQSKHQGQLHFPTIPEPPCIPTQTIKMALNPVKSATFDDLAHNYGAIDFQDELADFIVGINWLEGCASSLHQWAEDIHIPFCSVPVFHNINFTKCKPPGESEISDSVHAWPEAVGLHMQIIPARFDTIIVHQDWPNGPSNNKGMYLIDKTGYLTNHYTGVRIAQVHVVFQIPKWAILNVAPSLVLCPHVSGLHQDRKVFVSYLWQHASLDYDGMSWLFLTLTLGLRWLYYFSFVTAWPAGFKVDSTRVFKGRSYTQLNPKFSFVNIAALHFLPVSEWTLLIFLHKSSCL